MKKNSRVYARGYGIQAILRALAAVLLLSAGTAVAGQDSTASVALDAKIDTLTVDADAIPAMNFAARDAALAGNAAFNARDYVQAEQHYQRSLAALQDRSSSQASLELLVGIGNTLSLRNQPAAAEGYYRRAARQAQRDDVSGMAANRPEFLLALSLVQQHKNREAAQLFAQLYSQSRTLFGEHHLSTINLLSEWALRAYHGGDFDTAQKLIPQALAERLSLPEDKPRNLAQLYAVLADLEQQRDPAAAESHGRMAVTLWEQLDPHAESLAFVLANLGDNLIHQGRYAEAQDLLERSLALYREQQPPVQQAIARSACGLANALQAQGKNAAALALANEGLALVTEQRDPVYLRCIWMLGAAQFAENDDRAAERSFREVLRFPATLLDQQEVQITVALDLAQILNVRERLHERRAVLQKALKQQRQLHPQPTQATGMLLYALGVNFFNEHNYAAALAPLQEALSIFRQVPLTHPELLTYCLATLGGLREQMKDMQGAERYALEMQKRIEDAPVPPHIDVALAYVSLADIASHRREPLTKLESLYRSGFQMLQSFDCDTAYLYAGYRLAETQFRMRQLQEADSLLRDLHARLPSCEPLPGTITSQRITLLLARLLQVQGKRAQAQILIDEVQPVCERTISEEIAHACQVLRADAGNEQCELCQRYTTPNDAALPLTPF
jgi:tetratricopeptide (TPR) repeat protein